MKSQNYSERLTIAAEQCAKEKEYWLNKFSDHFTKSSFPYDFHKTIHTHESNPEVITFRFTGELSGKLMQLSNNSDPRLHMILTAAAAVLLKKYSYTGESDIIIGIPIYKQDLQGEFTNTVLALRNCVRGSMTFKELLLQVRQTIVEAVENQAYPIEILARQLNLQSDWHGFPLFDVAVLLQNIHDKKYLANIHLNIIFSFSRKDRYIEGCIEFNPSAYHQSTPPRLIHQFTQLLKHLLDNINAPLNRLEILSEEEKKQLLLDFSNTFTGYPRDKTIPVLFENQAEKNPGGIALVSEEKHLTYRQLNTTANQLAAVLAASGVKPGTGAILGIMQERSLEMIIGVVGILKAGGAYLPINPAYPRERIAYMLADSETKILLAEQNTRTKVKDAVERGSIKIIDIIDISGFLSSSTSISFSTSTPRFCSANLAYIIYTSGTTGKPKAVMVEHLNVVRLVINTNYIRFNPGDGILQTGALEFDASTFEIWGSLLNGLQLHLVSNEIILSPGMLKQTLQKNRITTIWLTAPLFNQLLDQDIRIFKGLTYLLVGGDVLSPPHINRLRNQYPHLKIINGYGPTENTTFSTTFLIDKDYQTAVPIGSPISHSTAYIVDKYNRLLPVGIPGELLVGGDGVARGYLNRPGLTAEKFCLLRPGALFTNILKKQAKKTSIWETVSNIAGPQGRARGWGRRPLFEKNTPGPYKNFLLNRSQCPNTPLPHQTIYRTGDLAKWLPDGNIEFIGRIDQQVKIRGFRIEPGEIEKCLKNIPKVKAAVVIIKENESAGKFICAYFTAEEDLPISRLQNHLSDQLPDYMIPSYFVRLDNIPLNPNGKVDVKALPEPGLTVKEEYIAPTNPLEEKMQETWAEVLALEKEKISIDADFFELGGHSLTATTLVSKMHKAFNVNVPLREVFCSPTIRQLSQYIKGAVPDQFSSIQPLEKREYYLLSSTQRRLYILQQMTPHSIAYNMPLVLPLSQTPDKEKLEQAFKQLVQRHESFRTSFHMIEDEPAQKIHKTVDFAIEFFDPDPGGTFVHPFDLSRAPLLRVGLRKNHNNHCFLMVDMHHIISDGVSMQILERDFKALYGEKQLPNLRRQYKDYAHWQIDQSRETAIKKQEIHWLKQFKKDVPVLDLPCDYPRPAVQRFEGRGMGFQIDSEETRLLKKIARTHGATMFMVLLTVYYILLSRLGSQEDIVVGTPTAGRVHADLQQIIGMFVNTLALRNSPHGEKTFTGFLQEVKKHLVTAFENQNYPFEDLVERVESNRDISRNPLFDVMFTFHDFGGNRDEITPHENHTPPREPQQTQHEHEHRTAKFDLTLAGMDSGNRLLFTLEYSTHLFKEETIERFIAYFKRITTDITKNTGKKLAEIELISPQEKEWLLSALNNTGIAYPRHHTLQRLFEQQARKKPDNTALLGLHQTHENSHNMSHPSYMSYMSHMSYKELNKKSLHLARLLRVKGVTPGMIVGIMLERSMEMIIAIFGILKAGAAYMPIDPDYPKERINYMLKDSNSGVLITTPNLRIKVKTEVVENSRQPGLPLQFIHIHTNPAFASEPSLSTLTSTLTCQVSPANLAYIIYTSGTSGKPKGVMIEHRNLIRLLFNDKNLFDFGSRDVWTLFHSYCFDFSVWEIYGALLYGGKLIIVTKMDARDRESFLKILMRQAVTVLNQTPSAFYNLISGELKYRENKPVLRYIIFGGEALNPAKLKKWQEHYPGTKLINMYGITETTVHVTYKELREKDIETSVSNMGKPIPTLSVYILDKNLKLLPRGIPGEICVGGEGVGRGYLNRPALTRGKFVINPYQRTGRLYRSGDMARIIDKTADMEYLGRIDQQVKIRGFRVELGEIENQLSIHKDIKEAAVTVRESGPDTDGKDRYICAYIVSDKDLAALEPREYLSKKLPEYMIPSYFIPLEKVPLTSSGKIDRRALPEPKLNLFNDYIAPQTPLQEKLVTIWSEVLGLEKNVIGIDNDFFELGGHSLKATTLLSKIHKVLNVKLPLVEIFKNPTIRDLSRCIREAEKDRYTSLPNTEKKEYYPLSSAQKRLYILQQMEMGGTAYNMPQVIPLAGDIEKEKLEKIFKLLIQRHESFRTCFEMVEKEPVQKIHKHVEFKIGDEHVPTDAASFVTGHLVRPFDLSRPPLLRTTLLQAPGEKYFLLVDMHHIVADGTSHNLLQKDFTALYRGEPLPHLRLQYKDYAQWQSGDGQKQVIQQEDHWLDVFSDEPPVLNLPIDYPRPLMQHFEGAAVDFAFSKKESQTLKRIAKQANATLYMTILTIYSILLAKISGQEDIIVGTPVAARRHADLEHIVGMFVNTLAMRNFLTPTKTFDALLTEIKERTLKAFENQEYQFEDLVEKVSIQRDTSRNPLFDVMFNLLNLVDYEGNIPDTREINDPPPDRGRQEEYHYEHRTDTSKFDLNLTAVEWEDRILCNFQYCTKLFKSGTIDKIIRRFKKIVSVLSLNINKLQHLKISAIEITTKKEKQEILALSVGREEIYDPGQTIHRLFEEQAAVTPDNIALNGPGHGAAFGGNPRTMEQHLSYRELNKNANGLALLLRSKGVKPNTVVGLMMERSIRMIIGMLAILKAGGAYVPVDSAYPGERKIYMLENSGVKLLLVNIPMKPGDSHHWIPQDIEMINLADERIDESQVQMMNPRHLNRGPDLLYVIYTSGSTGKPKGVMLEHRNLINLTLYQYKYTNIDFSKVLQFTTISFDVSFQEIFSTLLFGGQLCLLDKETRDNIPKLFKRVQQQDIKTMFLPASFLKFVINEETFARCIPPGIKHLVTAGEQVVVGDRLREYLQKNNVFLHNHYGPSETHVVTALTLDPAGEISELPSIGKPVTNTAVYLVDRAHRLVPVNVPGELLIGGIQLGRGYLNNSDLTAEKFDRDLWDFQDCRDGYHRSYRSYKTYILYRTGDLARWLHDGNIEFLGRMDHQVKIRGFRVELGEIESRLLNYNGIKETVVQARTDETGARYLCAYIVSKRELAAAELRQYLSNHLPDYMIPSYFVPLEKIPLTPNGKIDRSALPAPGILAGEVYTAPRTEVEEKLAAIWAEVLALDKAKISIDHNFFELGGHSLKATTTAAKIHQALDINIPLAELFRKPTIRGLAGYIRKSARDRYAAVESAEKKEYYVLSSSQSRLYILQQMAASSTVYNMPQTIPLKLEPRTMKLEQIFTRLIQRHESLRTSFHMVGNEPVQRVHPPEEVEFHIHRFNPGNQHRFVQPFDLARAPLLRAGLVELTQEAAPHCILMVDMHHIISDGISHQVLERDFIALDKETPLPALRLQYRDYAQWQTGETRRAVLMKQESYWLKEFAGEIPVLALPTDFPRPALQDFQGQGASFGIDGRQAKALKRLAAEEGMTLYMVLLSIYFVLLAKLSSQEDIVVGTPVAGRRHADLQQIIGMFVNTLPLRNFPAHEKTFSAFLAEVKKQTLNAFENQEYHFEDLVEKVAVNRDAGRNPLFDVMFSMRTLDDAPPGGTSAEGSPDPGPDAGQIQFHHEHQTAKFDITLAAMEYGQTLHFALEYCSRLFQSRTIERFAGCFKRVISEVIENKNKKLGEIEIIARAEKEQVLMEFNDTRVEYPAGKTVDELIEAQAKKTPAHIALVLPGAKAQEIQLTYRELTGRTYELACRLQKQGIRPGTIAAIMVERSIEMVIGILAILKAGGAYLPIEPDYPPERIEYILSDSKSRLLLTGASLAHSLNRLNNWEMKEDSRIIFIDANEFPGVSVSRGPGFFTSYANDLVYVLYTSGSTGYPKGVMVTGNSLVNLLFTLANAYPFSRGDTYLLKTPYVFDVSISELFGWFWGGGRMAILEKGGEKDPGKIIRAIQRYNVTHINFVPAMFHAFVESLPQHPGHPLKGLKYIFLAGETLPADVVKRFRSMGTNPGPALENLYGPTEATVYASKYSLAQWQEGDKIPIGKPLDNTAIYIVNRSNHHQFIGIPGELCISGAGLARGYLNQPELTAEKFDRDLWDYQDYHDGYHRSHRSYRSYKSYILYRSGDLARWLPEGNIEFLGRLDNQVKIRGFRVELGEIEHQLANHKQVKEAVVLTRTDRAGDKYLCAYVVWNRADHIEKQEQFSASGLKEYLSGHLPGYMIPACFVQMETMPLSASGKIHRQALPEPGFKAAGGYAAPRDEIEAKLAEIWSEVLAREVTSMGIDDNFFESGGHSLKATIMTTKIHQALEVNVPLAEIFKTPTIRGLAKYIRAAARDKFLDIPPVEKKEYYGLSSAQKRLYILQQMDPGITVYNMPMVIPLSTAADSKQLEQGFIKLIQRHESPRTSFHMVEEEAVQKIHKTVDFAIEYYHLEGTFNEGGHFIRPFDLSRAPLLRVGIREIPGGGYHMIVDMHHIISDGVSHEILERDFISLYRGEHLPDLRLQYKDYAYWQITGNRDAAVEKQETYWLNQLQGEIPVLNLPYDYPRPAVQSYEGHSVSFAVDSEMTKQLKEIALKEGSTLYMVLLSLYNILLSRLSGQEDIVIGTPIAGRRHADLQEIIGMFVNTLALRNSPGKGKTFTGFLAEVKKQTLATFENQEYPFEKLVEKVAVNRDTSRNPLFDVMFSLHNIGENNEEAAAEPEPGQTQYGYERRVSMFDITLTAMESGNRLLFALEYSSRLFEKETIERFIAYFRRIIAHIAKHAGTRISGIEIISPQEKKQVLYDFNNTEAEYPKDKTIVELIEKQVQKTPHHIAAAAQSPGDKRTAACIPDHALTYRELNRKSNQLARLLREKGVTPDTLVGIMVERSLEMLIGMMGILKAGMAYLPVAPDHPAARKKYMLEDSAVKVLLTQKYLLEEYMDDSAYPSLENIYHIDDESIYRGKVSNLSLINQPGDLAYMMYTSGSTGNPKGVIVEQAGVVNLLSWFAKTFEIQPGTRVLLLTDYTFDPSIEDIWGTFMYGAALYIATKEIVFNREMFCQFVKKNRISLIDFVPNMLKELLCHEEKLESLEVVISGGEKLEESLKDQLIEKGYRLYNNYGPTEITVDALSAECSPGKVNLGKPIDNMRCYILAENDQPQPVGIPGELCVAGKGLARGYLNRPELTADKFDHDLWDYQDYHDKKNKRFCGCFTGPRGKLYKTGDLSRWLPDGKIEFLGRKDDQLKIRGYRVEPGEIENQLLNIEHIKQAVVISPEIRGTDKYICAYIVAEKEFLVSELREYLSHQLPEYMIPTYFGFLDKIPLTPNGKIDRKALPEPEITLEQAHVTPQDEVEAKLAAIWSEVLGLEEEKISMEVNFFELGGHSLKATVMAAKIHQRLHIRVPVIEVFKRPTIRKLAEYINSTGKQKKSSAPIDNKLVMLREINGSPKHLFLVHDGSGEVEGYIELCNCLTNDFNCWGIKAGRLTNYAPGNLTIQDLARAYVKTIQTVQPQGPYCIAGWSIGGTIAFEIVRQLEKMNREIKRFVIIDAPPPHRNLMKNRRKFTLESELNWVRKYLTGNKIKEKLKNIATMQQLWKQIVDYLISIRADVEIIKKIIREYEGHVIPNYDSLGIKELIEYLNISRSLDHARAFYIPVEKINTSIHYFAASQSKGSIEPRRWNKYTRDPVQCREIPGNHLSILNVPAVKELAKKIDALLEPGSASPRNWNDGMLL